MDVPQWMVEFGYHALDWIEQFIEVIRIGSEG